MKIKVIETLKAMLTKKALGNGTLLAGAGGIAALGLSIIIGAGTNFELLKGCAVLVIGSVIGIFREVVLN